MKRWHAVLACALLVCALLACASGGTPAQTMGATCHTLTISSEVPIEALNVTTGIIFGATDGENEIVLLAREGDLLWVAGEDEEEEYGLWIRYRPADGLRLRVRWETQATYKVFLNDRLVALEVWDEPALWRWMRSADAREFRDLRSMYYSAEQGDLSALSRLAKLCPHLGLAMRSASDAEPGVEAVVALFQPAWLALTEGQELSAGMRPGLKHLKLLFADDAGSGAVLRRLPRLEALISWEFSDDEIAFQRLPAHLESLTLPGGSLRSLSELGRFKHVRDLHVTGRSLRDIAALPSLTRLRSLGLLGCDDIEDASALHEVSGLEWVTFPPGINQEDFAACIEANRGLQVVGIQGCDDLEDLSALERLPRLSALLLDPPEEDSPTLPALPRLVAVFLSDNDVSGAQRAQLEASFPNAQVAVAAGFCLGSGWILPVVPLAVAATWIARRRRTGSRA